MSTAVALLQQKRLVRARAQLDAQRVADALLKAQGADGKKGDKGDTGPMPGHEWQGTKLRFEKPDGGWGELVELRGPKGARGDRGPGGGGGGGNTATVVLGAMQMVTTPPIPIVGGRIALPSLPSGNVVWNTVLVYTDLQPSDFDSSGMLIGNRNYPVEDHVVRTSGATVIFTTPPADGLHAVVSYITAAP